MDDQGDIIAGFEVQRISLQQNVQALPPQCTPLTRHSHEGSVPCILSAYIMQSNLRHAMQLLRGMDGSGSTHLVQELELFGPVHERQRCSHVDALCHGLIAVLIADAMWDQKDLMQRAWQECAHGECINPRCR